MTTSPLARRSPRYRTDEIKKPRRENAGTGQHDRLRQGAAWISFPAGSSSAWPSRARWSTSRRCCYWTSRWAHWTLKLRKDMQLELKRMQQALGITFLYVTHDQEEALTMSDTVVVMRDGKNFADRRPQERLRRARQRLCSGFYRREQHHARRDGAR